MRIVIAALMVLVLQESASHAQMEKKQCDLDRLPAGARLRLGSLCLKYKGYIRSLNLSPDGRFIVTVAESLQLERVTTDVWSMDTGQRVFGLTNEGRTAIFSPDGTLLATASGLWHVATGKHVAAFDGRLGIDQDVAYSADGKLLAIQNSRTITVWSVADQKQLVVIKSDANLSSVTLSSGGDYVASVVQGEYLQTIPQIWDVRTGKPIRDLKFEVARQEGEWAPRVTRVRFSPDGKTLAGADNSSFAHTDHWIHLWDAASGKELAPLLDEGSGHWSFAFSSDGRVLATVSHYHGVVRLWDVRQAKVLRELNAHAQQVAFSRDGSLLVTGGGNSLRFWDPATGAERPLFKGHCDTIRSLSFAPDENKLASSSDDGTMRLWDTNTGTQLLQCEVFGPRQGAVDFSPGGGLIVAAGYDGSYSFPSGIRIWEVDGGRLRRQIETAPKTAWFLEVRPTLLTWNEQGLSYWDVNTSKKVREVEVYSDTQHRPAVISQNRQHVAISDTLFRTLILGATSAEQLCEIKTRDVVMAKALSANGKLLALGTGDWQGSDVVLDGGQVAVRLFDVATGNEFRTIEGNEKPISSLCFSPDGKQLVVASFDQTVSVWDLQTGKERSSLDLPQEHVTAIAFSPNGTWLATADTSATILVWDTASLDKKGK